MIETFKLCILLPVWMTLTSIQGQYCTRDQKRLIFSHISQSIRMKCSMLPQTAALLKFMLNIFCVINSQGRKLYLCDFVKCSLALALVQMPMNRFLSNVV